VVDLAQATRVPFRRARPHAFMRGLEDPNPFPIHREHAIVSVLSRGLVIRPSERDRIAETHSGRAWVESDRKTGN